MAIIVTGHFLRAALISIGIRGKRACTRATVQTPLLSLSLSLIGNLVDSFSISSHLCRVSYSASVKKKSNMCRKNPRDHFRCRLNLASAASLKRDEAAVGKTVYSNVRAPTSVYLYIYIYAHVRRAAITISGGTRENSLGGVYRNRRILYIHAN